MTRPTGLRWYLERYSHWPVGVFAERAHKVVKKLPEWGGDLFEAALKPDAARNAYETWKRVGDDTVRRFNIEVDTALPEGSSEEEQRAAEEAATLLLALPWELLHGGESKTTLAAEPGHVASCGSCRALRLDLRRGRVPRIRQGCFVAGLFHGVYDAHARGGTWCLRPQVGQAFRRSATQEGMVTP